MKGIRTEEDVGSDHIPVTLTLKAKPSRPQVLVSDKPNLNKADWKEFRKTIENKIIETPVVEPTKLSIDNAVTAITELIQSADTETIPRKRQMPPDSKPLPQAILGLINLRRQVLKISRSKKNPDNIRKQAKTLANNLQHRIRDEVAELERRNLDKIWTETIDKSQYGFWKLASKLSKTENGPATNYPIKNNLGKRLQEDQGKCEEFRKLYETIYQTPPTDPEFQELENEVREFNEALGRTFENIRKHNLDSDFDTDVRPQDITNALRRTRNTAPGTDKIYYTHIKQLPDTALEYLASIYQLCIECAYFPDKWKKGATTLIPKPNKDHTDPKSYRPITLLSALGKTLERIILNRLKPHIERNNLLPDSQAGFRSGRSTQDQLFKLTQTILRGFQSNQTTLATFFDIEKAFDKMWIQGLLYKMHSHLHLKLSTIGLLRSFLSNRTVEFKINNTYSTPLTLRAGTPQGSILSPSLFNMSVSDIPQPDPKTDLSQFADDISTWATGTNTSQTKPRLQNYNNKIHKWCKKWKIKLAPAKTQLIEFKAKKKRHNHYITQPTQQIADITIEAQKEATFLGIIFDPQLTFKKQHAKVVKQLKQRTSKLINITGTSIHPRASPKTAKQIVKAMIYSCTQYAPTVGILRSDKQFEEQDNILRRAVRLAHHIPKNIAATYTDTIAKLPDTKTQTYKLARSYLNNPNRSAAITNFVNHHTQDQLLRPARQKRLHSTLINKLFD